MSRVFDDQRQIMGAGKGEASLNVRKTLDIDVVVGHSSLMASTQNRQRATRRGVSQRTAFARGLTEADITV
jgi:hypothetical protein